MLSFQWTRQVGRQVAQGLRHAAIQSVHRPVEVILLCTVLVSCTVYILWHHVPVPIQLSDKRSVIASTWRLEADSDQFIPWTDESRNRLDTSDNQEDTLRVRVHQLVLMAPLHRSRKSASIEQWTYSAAALRDAVQELKDTLPHLTSQTNSKKTSTDTKQTVSSPAASVTSATTTTRNGDSLGDNSASLSSTKSKASSVKQRLDTVQFQDICKQGTLLSNNSDGIESLSGNRTALCLRLPSYRINVRGAARDVKELRDQYWNRLMSKLDAAVDTEDIHARSMSSGANTAAIRPPDAVVLTYALDTSRIPNNSEDDILQRWMSTVIDTPMEMSIHRNTDGVKRGYYHTPLNDGRNSASLYGHTLEAFYEILYNVVAGLRKASTLELAVVSTAYFLLHVTIGMLFYKMRRIGSRWTLGVAAIMSSIAGFCMALCTVGLLGFRIDLLFFSEAIPFLVVIVGFEKPYALSKAVISMSTPADSDAPLDRLAERQVFDGINKILPRLLRDYLFEISVLVFGIVSGVPGLSEFCLLSTVTLIFDCMLQFTLFTAVLTLKCELNLVRREREQQQTHSNSNSSSDHTKNNLCNSNESSAKSTSTSTQLTVTKQAKRRSNNARHTRHASIDTTTRHLNVLRPFLSERRTKKHGTTGSSNPDTTQSVVVARCKLFMMIVFLGMHIFNICSAFHGHLPPRPGAEPDLSNTVQTVIGQLRPDNPIIHGPLGALVNDYRQSKEKRALVVDITTPVVFEAQRIDEEFSFIDTLMTIIVDSFGGPLRGHARNATYEQLLTIGLFVSLMANWYLYSGDKRHHQQHQHESHPSTSDHTIDAISKEKALRQSTSGNKTPSSTTATINEAKAVVIYKSGTITDNRDEETCLSLLATTPAELTDEEVIALVQSNKLPGYALEKKLGDFERAVKIRRAVISRASITGTLEHSELPMAHYDYKRVFGQCCENVIGYTPIPIGVAGPIRIDGKLYHIPMTTTEGCLVASTSRGCKAISAGGRGATTVVVNDGMTRGPAVEFSSITQAAACKLWVDQGEGFTVLADAFNSTSRFARLQSIKVMLAGKLAFIRFKATTGDAMGMNMISKGVEKALLTLSERYHDMRIVSISGNTCSDKKPAAINWIEGRGKSTLAECTIDGDVVKSVLKTTVADLVRLNTSKNLVGSAMAGSVGGFNAHASNILTAIYLATGQDPAQNVESSQCITLMQAVNDGRDLHLSCTMPCIEVGTIGGGTQLPAQAACLDMLGVKGAHATQPGDNARQLARIICASVMAGELSLCAALAAGHLVQSHMAHNRAANATTTTTTTTAAAPVPGSCLRS
ncbi:hydroxymethylglutaryl-coenzyme A reductase-domain-containing protein [Syncephalis plumigaleata]|nr:hydroxymethylglutaryl-coenzyme A reductase-domain-containing protein [Syncephalis plumigaleata]